MTRLNTALVFLGIALLSAPARAACTTPDGIAGHMFFNGTYNVMQYCNGSVWINMGGGVSKDYVDAAVAGSGGVTMVTAESASTMTLAAAINYCRDLTAACQYKEDETACDATTYSDWRVPSVEEASPFVGLTSSATTMWTVSPVSYLSTNRRLVFVYSSGSGSDADPTAVHNVRCVR